MQSSTRKKMKNLLTNNNRTGALMTILVLAVGSISVVATTHLATTFAHKKKCDDNDNKNCNDTHKTQKIDEKNKCKVESENEDHSSRNGNENSLECVNFGANLNDVVVTPSGVGQG